MSFAFLGPLLVRNLSWSGESMNPVTTLYLGYEEPQSTRSPSGSSGHASPILDSLDPSLLHNAHARGLGLFHGWRQSRFSLAGHAWPGQSKWSLSCLSDLWIIGLSDPFSVWYLSDPFAKKIFERSLARTWGMHVFSSDGTDIGVLSSHLRKLGCVHFETRVELQGWSCKGRTLVLPLHCVMWFAGAGCGCSCAFGWSHAWLQNGPWSIDASSPSTSKFSGPNDKDPVRPRILDVSMSAAGPGTRYLCSTEDRKAASAGHSIFAATPLGSEGVSHDARSSVLPMTLPDTRKWRRGVRTKHVFYKWGGCSVFAGFLWSSASRGPETHGHTVQKSGSLGALFRKRKVC